MDIVTLNESTLPLAKELIALRWGCEQDDPRFERFFVWRFLERGRWDALLAIADGKGVAFLDSGVRIYRCGEQCISVREPSEWYADPKYRPVGLTLFKRMMAMPEPMLSIGGSAITRNILPRLGWVPLSTVSQFTLPLQLGSILNHLLKGLNHFRLVRIAGGLTLPFALRHSSAPVTGLNYSVRSLSGESRALSVTEGATCALASTLNDWELDWFGRAPSSAGTFELFEFSDGQSWIGHVLVRLYTSGGLPRAYIMHIDTAAVALPVIRWIISQASAFCRERGVAVVHARTSSGMLMDALRQSGFFQRGTLPVHMWPTGDMRIDGATRLDYLRGDDGLRPNLLLDARAELGNFD